MLINPSHSLPPRLPPREKANQPACEARLRRLLMVAKGKVRQAIAALVWRLSVHPSQACGDLSYTELSVGYIALAADVGRETARQAWHLVKSCLGWFTVKPNRVRAMGLSLRQLRPGGKWGQHLLLSKWAKAAADSVCAALDLAPANTGDVVGQQWQPVTVYRHGRHMMCRCPWHQDTKPSMLLNMNADGVSGSAVCFACSDGEGAPLRGYWRSTPNGVKVRQTGNTAGGAPSKLYIVPAPCVTASTGGGRYVLGRHGKRSARRASQCGDLLDLLRRADRRSLTDTAVGDAAWEHGRGARIPDCYVSVDRMTPSEWQTIPTKNGDVRVPSRWEPVATRWLLVDLDGFVGAPVDDRGLVVAGKALERWCGRTAGLSGRVGIVRTSHHGVQVVLELESEQAKPRAWYRTKQAKALMAAADTACLAAVRSAGFEGGHADTCSHTAGRNMRRPSWRVDKTGSLRRSRLSYATER